MKQKTLHWGLHFQAGNIKEKSEELKIVLTMIYRPSSPQLAQCMPKPPPPVRKAAAASQESHRRQLGKPPQPVR
jgi:hypothetical protein